MIRVVIRRHEIPYSLQGAFARVATYGVIDVWWTSLHAIWMAVREPALTAYLRSVSAIPYVTEARCINLRGANLRGANLRGLDLTLADLSGADLRDAEAFRTSFVNTYLDGSDLRSANLMLANLRGANLRGVKTSSATNMRGADMRGAEMLYEGDEPDMLEVAQ